MKRSFAALTALAVLALAASLAPACPPLVAAIQHAACPQAVQVQAVQTQQVQTVTTTQTVVAPAVVQSFQLDPMIQQYSSNYSLAPSYVGVRGRGVRAIGRRGAARGFRGRGIGLGGLGFGLAPAIEVDPLGGAVLEPVPAFGLGLPLFGRGFAGRGGFRRFR